VTRRTVLALAAGSFAGRADIRYRQYARCFPDFLTRLAREAHQKRNAEIAKLTSSSAIRQRQAWVTETFWRLTGGQPERTPLNTRVTGSFERAGYKVEKLVYESRPGLHIPANLYIPKGHQPPFPGVLFQMGHSSNGKAHDVYQKCCQGLARLNYVVLAFDPWAKASERITLVPLRHAPGCLAARMMSTPFQASR